MSNHTILAHCSPRGLTTGALALLLGAAACSSNSETPAAEGGAASATSAGGTGAVSTSSDVAVTNATNFHLLDFVGWNNRDTSVFRRLHTADVKVDFGGNRTEGIEVHVQALQPMWGPGSELIKHTPVVAEGEWTCMVGTGAPPGNMKMVTVAKWRDGAISEEYILVNLLKPGIAKPAVSGSPVMSISNQNPELQRLVGAEPGWTCSLERTADGKMVISVGRTGGTPAEQMVFTQ